MPYKNGPYAQQFVQKILILFYFAHIYLFILGSSIFKNFITLITMSYHENETEIELKKMYMEKPNIAAFMDELVYGRQMQYFNVNRNRKSSIFLHLHPTWPDILIGTEGGPFLFVFNLNKARTDRVDITVQMNYNLEEEHMILIEEGSDEICLIFNKIEEKNDFVNNFKGLAEIIRKIPKDLDPMIMKNFIKADTNKNLILSKPEIIKLLQDIHLEDEEEINAIVGQENYISNGQTSDISFRDFQKIIMVLLCRKQMVEIFKKYCNFQLVNREYLFIDAMNRDQFEQFLKNQQRETKASIRQISDKLFRKDSNNFKRKISFYSFCQYIMSSQNSALDYEYQQFKTDEDMPLNHYYVFSSHNTYLVGNQLTSDSNAERYYEDLCNGIRCVEIDCHDGSQGPIVKHGYTATSSITFDSVIDEIHRFCREKQNVNHTPIIISLQNHCNNANQVLIAKKIMNAFSDCILFIQDYNEKYPTLRQSRGKIIVRGTGSVKIHRKIIQLETKQQIEEQIEYPEEIGSQGESDSENMIISPNSQVHKLPESVQKVSKMVESKGMFQFDFQAEMKKFQLKVGVLVSQKASFIEKREQFHNYIETNYKELTSKKEVKTLNHYLVKITAMLNCGSMSLGEASPWESISLSENKIQQMYYSKKSDRLRAQAQKSWVRVYPKGIRIDSSNYDPLTALEFGAQIIALNTQSVDYYTQILKKFFMKGHSHTAGFRLKPTVLPEPEVQRSISITPISASHIYYNDRKRKDQIPAVQVRMRYFGVIKDNQNNSYYNKWNGFTEKIGNNACNPVFKKGQMMTLRLTSTELGFIALQIEGCGVGILPIDGIKMGYRSVTLYDEEYEPKECKIICLIH